MRPMTVAYVRQRLARNNGQRVFDDRLSAALAGKAIDFREVLVSPNGWRARTGIPYYARRLPREEFEGFDAVILSHYRTFDSYHSANRCLIQHDVPYDAYLTSGRSMDRLRGTLLRRNIVAQAKLATANFYISEHEFKKYGAGASSVRIYAGMPPSVSSRVPTVLRRRLTVSGNYRWSLKRRALAASLPTVARLFDEVELDTESEAAASMLRAAGIQTTHPATDSNDDDILAYGLIPDNFVSGFKMRALDLIARRRILISFADIREEFDGLTHADLFVNYVREPDDVTSTLSRIDAQGDAIFSMFAAFRAQVAERFSWDRSADIILKTLWDKAGTAQTQ